MKKYYIKISIYVKFLFIDISGCFVYNYTCENMLLKRGKYVGN